MFSPLFIITVLAPFAACKRPIWPPPLKTTIIYEHVAEPVTSGAKASPSPPWCPVSTYTATVTKLCGVVPGLTHVPAHTSVPAPPKSDSVTLALGVSTARRPVTVPTSTVPLDGSTRRLPPHKPTAFSKNATAHSIPHVATSSSLHAPASSSSHTRVSTSSHVRVTSTLHYGIVTSTRGNLTSNSPVSTAIATRYRVPVNGFNATMVNATTVNATVTTVRHSASTPNMTVPATSRVKHTKPPTTKLPVTGTTTSKLHLTVGGSSRPNHTSHPLTPSKTTLRHSSPHPILLTPGVPPLLFPSSIPAANSTTKSPSHTRKAPVVLPSHTKGVLSSPASNAGMPTSRLSVTHAQEEISTSQVKTASHMVKLAVSTHSAILDPAAESRAWSILEEALRELSRNSYLAHHMQTMKIIAPASTSITGFSTKGTTMYAHPTSKRAIDD